MDILRILNSYENRGNTKTLLNEIRAVRPRIELANEVVKVRTKYQLRTLYDAVRVLHYRIFGRPGRYIFMGKR